MAKKNKAPEQDSNSVGLSDAEINAESQQPEQQTDSPPIVAEATPLAAEATMPATEEVEETIPPEPISFEEAKAAIEAEAAAVEMPALEEQEDTRQEWEKPLAEIEAEQQPKRKGRPTKTAEDKETSGQVGAVDKVGLDRVSAKWEQEKRRLSASSHTLYHPLDVQSGRGEEAVVFRCL